MKIVLDSNVLLRVLQSDHPQSTTAESAIEFLESQGHTLCVLPQSLYEFWVVATRPVVNNGLEYPAHVADAAIEDMCEQYQILRDERGILQRWRQLVKAENVLGKNAHDARIAAALERHGLRHLMTFNVADFKRFKSLVIVDPQEVADGKTPTA